MPTPKPRCTEGCLLPCAADGSASVRFRQPTMKESGLRVGSPLAETVEEPSSLTNFRVCLGQADRPVLSGLTLLRWELGHIVVEVATAEGPGEPAPAHPLCHILLAQ